MPRKTIRNEEEAAKLVASVAVKVMQKKATSQELHSIATAMSIFGSLLKQGRDAAKQQYDDDKKMRLEKCMKKKFPDEVKREILYNDFFGK